MCLHELGDFFAKPGPRSMQQNADYHLGRAEHLGDFEITVPFKVLEDDDLGSLGTKRRN